MRTILVLLQIPLRRVREPRPGLSNEEFFHGCRLHMDRRAQGTTCPICLEPVGTKYRRVHPCNHVFHGPCIEQWLRHRSRKCPTCRTECVPGRGT